MKTRKWLWWTVAVALTLVALGFTGLAGYRIGFMQGTGFKKQFAAQIQNNANGTQPTAPEQFNPHGRGFKGNDSRDFGGRGFDSKRGFDGRGFDNRGFDRRDSHSFFSLVGLALLALVVWLGYKYIKNSGWRLTRVTVEQEPVAEEPAPKKAKK